MHRNGILLAFVLSASVWAQSPVYTAASIVNSSDYSPGPFAPASVLSIFGTNLSWDNESLSVSQTTIIPSSLGNTLVYVDNMPAPMLYVSPTQINFIVPDNQIAGNVSVQVVREGVDGDGPPVTISLANAAPALFADANGLAIATDLYGNVLTDAAPAAPGQIVVIYATGLGATTPALIGNEVAGQALPIALLSGLSITLDGAAVPSGLIYYCGATPGYLGLYQINLQLPQSVGSDPVIQVTIGTQSSSGALHLAVQ